MSSCGLLPHFDPIWSEPILSPFFLKLHLHLKYLAIPHSDHPLPSLFLDYGSRFWLEELLTRLLLFIYLFTSNISCVKLCEWSKCIDIVVSFVSDRNRYTWSSDWRPREQIPRLEPDHVRCPGRGENESHWISAFHSYILIDTLLSTLFFMFVAWFSRQNFRFVV